MTLPSDFAERLAEKSEADLYDMLAHADDYLPEALDAAKAELAKRNLPSDLAKQGQADAEARKAQDDERAGAELPWLARLLILAGLFPFIPFAIYYAGRGYHRRAKQCWAWAGYSFLLWIAFSIVQGIFGIF